MRPPLLTLFMVSALCGGCVSAPSGKHWWSPATWGSSAPASKVAKLEVTENYAKQVLLLDAQGEVEKTVRVLRLAPESPAVSVARRTAGNASTMLTQANGALPFATLDAFDVWVAGILSDNKAEALSAEAQQARDERRYGKHSQELLDVQDKLEAANAKLLTSFARENELADTLRNERALRAWIIGGGSLLVLIAGAGWLYLQIATGGIPKAIGGMLKGLDQSDPGKADLIRSLLDEPLNRLEKALIRKYT